MATIAEQGHDADEPSTADIRLVISASALGTVFEWYDFFIYGTLAASGIIGRTFFPGGRPCSPGPESRSASASARSARWCSAISATVSGGNIPSSSRSP